jgi:hypothetical protein
MHGRGFAVDVVDVRTGRGFVVVGAGVLLLELELELDDELEVAQAAVKGTATLARHRLRPTRRAGIRVFKG